jgi:hypothetical protein
VSAGRRDPGSLRVSSAAGPWYRGSRSGRIAPRSGRAIWAPSTTPYILRSAGPAR